MGTAILLHHACARSELPLAAGLLSDELLDSGKAVLCAPSGNREPCDLAVWLGKTAPSGSLAEIATAHRWLVYPGDPATWRPGLKTALQQAGAHYVVAERFPDEWPDSIIEGEHAWLVENWLPLGFVVPEPTYLPMCADEALKWVVITRQGDKEAADCLKPSPALALVETGSATFVRLDGPACTWPGKMRSILEEHDVGIVAACADPVVDTWLASLCSQTGHRCLVAEQTGSPLRWADSAIGTRAPGSRHGGLRQFMSAWIQGVRDRGPRPISLVAMKDMVTGLAEQSNLLKGDAYGAISTVRRAFGAGAERDHPAGAFLRSDRRLWFWTALASGQPEAIEAALKLPTRAVADAAAVLAERVGQPGFDSVFRRIETVAPQAWRVVDAALAKHEGGRDRQFIRKVLASGLFMGAADALVGVGNDRVLTEAAGWFSGALEIECEDASPDPRCIAIPSLLVAGRVEEAGRLWERASGRVAKPVLAGALWRVFGAWLPVIESGGVVPESVVLWLVNRVRELQGDEKWTALLALLASCLGLYGWDKQHERRSWAGLHLDKGVAPATSGAFALFCWLRQDLECGRRVLDAIGEAWPTTPDEQFPIFCAMALFAPERARVWRAHFTEPDASFLARGTPAHTRCFFWSLALAAMGDGQRADALWQQALQDDPLSRVRAHHRMRLISEGRPGVLRSTLES